MFDLIRKYEIPVDFASKDGRFFGAYLPLTFVAEINSR